MLRKPLAIVVAGALAAMAAVQVASAGNGAQKTTGTFAAVPGYADYGITGTARLVRLPSERTNAKVKVEGLQPGQTYLSHVHNAPCSTGGGGHYQNQVGGATTPPNELWLATDAETVGITANPKGKAVGTGRADWLARPEAQSIVIHHYSDPAIRVACADLS